MSKPTREKPASFGLWTLTFLVVANMVGAGVFTTSGYAMGDLRYPHWVVLAWIIAGLIAIAGAISYGKLIQKLPESGGEYLFLSRAYHPMVGFVAGWVSMFAGFTGAIVVAATTFETYAVPDGWRDHIPTDSVAIGIVILAALIHGIKIKFGAWAQNSAVILKLALLAGFLIFGIFKLSSIETVQDLDPAPSLMPVFAKSLMFISFSYLGFNAAVYVAEEAGDAKRLIPRSLLLGTSIVVVLYVLLNVVFVYSGNPSEVMKSGGTVAAFSAERLGGPAFATLFRVIISIALLTSVTSMMMAAPRVYAKMAEDGLLPKFFKFENNAPYYSILLQVVLAIVILLSSNLESLLEYLGVTLSLCAAASVSSLFLPRFREGKSIWSITYLAPFIYIAATLVAVCTSCYFLTIWQLYAALITFSVGAILYLIKQAITGKLAQNEEDASPDETE